MADNRTQQWRATKRKQGLKAVTVWLTAAEEGRLKELTATWHCSPSDMMQHALTQFHPGPPPRLSDDTDASLMHSSHDTATSQIQDWLQAELPGMVQKIVEHLAVDMRFAEPSDSDVSDATQIQSSDVPVTVPRQDGNVTALATAGYDADKHYLGKLCPRGHAYEATGQSLRYRGSKRCIQCDTASARERRQAKGLR